MRMLIPALAAAVVAASATAQLSLVAPVGLANTEGNSNNVYPWNWASSSIRVQFIYDSSNFTQQGVAGPVTITRLRFRADSGAAWNWTGATYSMARIDMSTCPVDYLAVSGSWGANHGPNLTTVYNAPLTVQAGTTTAPGPGPFAIDIPLATPFLYDPTTGNDLTVDIQLPAFVGGSLVPIDHNSGTGVSRVYDTTGVSPTGTVGTNYGAVCEFSYSPGSGYASASNYGSGCPAASSAAVYELFQANTIDLSNMSLLFIPNGNGSYTIVPGPNVWFGGFTNNLGLTDDSIGAATMPYPFPHAGGSTSTLSVSSNGAVWLGASTNTSYSVTSLDFVTNMARIAPCWTDLNPSVGGGVYADLDAGTGDYVITWSSVPEFGSSGLVSMQVALQASGIFEIRYQGCSIAGHASLTGYSAGGGTVDPGSVDLSSVTTTPIVTGAVSVPLTLAASARPRLGTSFNLTTGHIPGGTPVGAVLLSLAQNAAGFDLTPLGAPGCRQYIGSSLSLVFVPAGPSANVPLSVPNNPALSGLHVYSQSVTLSSGYNALGVIFSNGVSLLLDAL